MQVNKVVDTTGAGDAFVGSLAYFIASNKDIPLQQVYFWIIKSIKENNTFIAQRSRLNLANALHLGLTIIFKFNIFSSNMKQFINFINDRNLPKSWNLIEILGHWKGLQLGLRNCEEKRNSIQLPLQRSSSSFTMNDSRTIIDNYFKELKCFVCIILRCYFFCNFCIYN